MLTGLLESGSGLKGFVMLPEFVRGAVAEARMRAHGVVVATPLLDDHARFETRAEPFQTQALVAQATVEALDDPKDGAANPFCIGLPGAM